MGLLQCHPADTTWIQHTILITLRTGDGSLKAEKEVVLEKLRRPLFAIACHKTTERTDCFRWENGGLRDDNGTGSVIREGLIVPVENRELLTYQNIIQWHRSVCEINDQYKVGNEDCPISSGPRVCKINGGIQAIIFTIEIFCFISITGALRWKVSEPRLSLRWKVSVRSAWANRTIVCLHSL